MRDIISVVDAKKYPFTSMARKGAAPKNTLVEWQVDSMPDPSFDGVLDGEDVQSHENMAEDRERLQTRVQIFRRSPMVSLLAEEVSTVAGIAPKGEMAKAIAKSIEALKRDMECAFCSDHDSQAQVKASGKPYLTRGLGSWISSTPQTDLPVSASYLTPAESIDSTATGSLTETHVNDVVQSIWDETGADKTYTFLTGRSLRRRISSFTELETGSTNVMARIRTTNQDAESRTLTNTIDILEGDFGSLEIVPSHFLARDNDDKAVQRARGYVLDFDLVEILYHTAPKRKPLQDGGGGPRELIYAIAALAVYNPLGLGKLNGTS